MSAFITTNLPFCRPSLRSNRQTTRCSTLVDAEAPPESRYASRYPSPRFEAPYISIFNSPEVPLINKVGVVREPVPLDLKQAADFLAQARAVKAQSSGDLSTMFCGPATDYTADNPVDKYYPSFRRDECPIIEIAPPTNDSNGSVTVAVGAVSATPPPEDQQVNLPDAVLGSPWNNGPRLSACQCIAMFFPPKYRNLAPVIEISSRELGINMEMKEIVGECEADLYPKETRFMAPNIAIRKPMGEWDMTAFVNLEMEEVQLPLIEAAILNASV